VRLESLSVSTNLRQKTLLIVRLGRHHFASLQLSLEQIDAKLVMDFLQHLETERHNGPRTRNARLVAIKSFMRFIEHRVPALLEQSRRILAIPAKRTDSHLISYLSMDEMQTVLNAPDLQRHDGIRDRAMLHLCFSAGLRVSELVNLPINAIEWQPSPNVPG
jgi:integrase/recombinase XerD